MSSYAEGMAHHPVRSRRGLARSLLLLPGLCLAWPVAALPGSDDSAFALRVDTERRLPVYGPRNEVEAAGVLAISTALPVIGEGAIVQQILTVAPELMGVDRAEGKAVKAALKRRYDELGDDPRWADVETPLVQAFEASAPTMLVAPPHAAGVDPDEAPVVLFLHGYGGNGLLFSWLLSTAMPEAWIVSPSHGLTWSRPDLRYLDDALRTFEAHRGRGPLRYHLVGLSDGAVGAFEVLAARSERFRSCTILAGTPREDVIAKLPRAVPLTWIAGRQDRFVSAKRVAARHARVRRRVRTTSLSWMPDGHYFLLNDDGAALSIVAAAVGAVGESGEVDAQ